jgi:hypothetical protein
LVALVLAAGVQAEPAPLLPAGATWTEQSGVLEQLRWWVRSEATARLRALGSAVTATTPTADSTRFNLSWQTPADRDAGLSDEERADIGHAKAEQVAKAFAPPAAAKAATLRLDATVREVWRPNAVLNVLIVALPGPGAPFVTQGGAAVEMTLRDVTSGDTLAAFTCRQYAGVGAFAYAFGRTGHPRIALQACADKFAAVLQRGSPGAANDTPAATSQTTEGG